MRARLALAAMTAAVMTLIPTTVSADVPWTGPGWYVTYTEMGFDTEVAAGPFSTQGDCQATLSNYPNTKDADYSCEYLTQKPD